MEQLVGWALGLSTGLALAYEECKQICATMPKVIYLIYIAKLFILR